ncbi:DNA topoisomerase I [Candidatus Pacearchaeota archaeon]|nr:DNA topoisomerase I [Candidatus Pacearchaeota archaeon]
MPKKQKKSREEKVAEEYFPMDEDDLDRATLKEVKEPLVDFKKTIEKEYKKPDRKSLETVEKITTKKPKKKARKKMVSKKKSAKKKITYSIPKINLKKDGYELIITEKPQAATKIASALGTPKQKILNKVSYYEIDREGRKIIVACAVGHLFALKQNKPGSAVPEFDVSWFPNYLVRKKDFSKRYYTTLLSLAKNAGSLTVATDFDIEGEVIGLNVVRFVAGQKDASRMKFSTLTSPELNKAYDKKSKHISWGQAIAGETRHYLDWFYGINLSRALMNAIKTTGKFRIMSIGRVQGPALNLIVKREREIQAFESEPYWQVFATISDGKNKLELKHNKDLFDKKDLSKFENIKGQTTTASTKKTEQIIPPNPPFNLTTLQTEAYKFHGITPSNTLRAAQSLYLTGLISYPRTSSQKLPTSIDYKTILKKIAKQHKVEKLITKQKPLEGKKTDPAHPSIYPTGETQILAGDDEKIYNLIVKRFLSLFCDDAIVDKKRVSAKVDDLLFAANGSSVRKKAWMEIYPSKLKEVEIPDFDGEVEITDSRTEEKETQPPKRYSPASIISQLEKKNLGTKSTRSSILETLYDRNYVKEKSIEATPLGMSLIATLEKYSPIIIDEELTRSFENDMGSILEAKNNFLEKEEKIINKAKKTIADISKDFEKHEKEIGKELLSANIKLREQQKEENKLNPCSKCKKGHLGITYSRKTKRQFVACDAYPDCKTTFSLPPHGMIKRTRKICEECQFPMLMSLRKGKRPWTFCFNPECPTNEERIKEYKKRISEEIKN